MLPSSLIWHTARFLPNVIAAGLVWTVLSPGRGFWGDLLPALGAMTMGEGASEEMVTLIVSTGLRFMLVLVLVSLWVIAMHRAKAIFGAAPRFWVWHEQARPDTLWERVMLETVSFRRALSWAQRSKLRRIPWLQRSRRASGRMVRGIFGRRARSVTP